MRTFLSVMLVSGTLLCAAAFAQSEPPSAQNPSAPAAQPQAQPATPSQPQAPASPSAQSGQAPSTAGQATAQRRIAPGSVIPVQLTKTVDAKKAKTGDPIMAKVTMDMTTSTGEVLVPKDTKVIGHITEAQARTKEQKESQLGIAFDRAVLKDGEVSLPMSIQAVIAPPSNNANGGESDQGASPPPVGGSAASPVSGGRNGSAGQTQAGGTPPSALPSEGSGASQGNGARPPINGNTQGVVGISNLKLEPGQNAAQGSVLSSEKNNVKVESGTTLLLKISQ
ncbi:MAG TPA: hypothetical protein VGK96_09860 [Candidatus Sulfotelmatobacter sp.]